MRFLQNLTASTIVVAIIAACVVFGATIGIATFNILEGVFDPGAWVNSAGTELPHPATLIPSVVTGVIFGMALAVTIAEWAEERGYLP